MNGDSITYEDVVSGIWKHSCQGCLQDLCMNDSEYKKFIEEEEKSVLKLFDTIGYKLPDSLSFRNNSAEVLFEYLSRATHLDLPLCNDCWDKAITDSRQNYIRDRQVRSVLERIIGSMSIQEKLDEKGSKEEEKEVESFRHSNDSYGTLQQEKEKIEKQIMALKSSIANSERHKLELEAMETKLSTSCNSLNTICSEISLEISDYQEMLNEVKQNSNNHERELLMLNKKSVLNDCFMIWYTGEYITINGIKMGKSGNNAIDWNDINSGLGDLLSITDCLYTLFGKKYDLFLPVVQGSYSIIIDQQSKLSYNLFYNPKNGNRKLFSMALSMFLKIVYSLVTSGMMLPYPIENDCVGKCDFLCNDYDIWFRAIKYLAIDIKQMIAYTSQKDIIIKSM